MFCRRKTFGRGLGKQAGRRLFPRKNELVGTAFDVNKEIADCARLSEQARQEADDAVQIAKFREQARKRFEEEGRDPDDESELKSAIFRERKMWIRERTTELGAERAECEVGRIFILIQNRSPNR